MQRIWDINCSPFSCALLFYKFCSASVTTQPLGKRIFKQVESESETQTTQLPNAHDRTPLGLPETGRKAVRTLDALLLGRGQKRRTVRKGAASCPTNAVLLSEGASVWRRVRRSSRREQPARSRRCCPSSRHTPRPCWSLHCKPVWLLARTPKGAQQGGGYKARAETMNRQRPFSFVCILFRSGSQTLRQPGESRPFPQQRANSKTQRRFFQHPQNQL